MYLFFTNKEFIATKLLGVASKTPFKRQRFKGPQTTTPVGAFFTYPPLIYLRLCWNRKTGKNWKSTAASTRLAGNPACQSRRVHAVNKLRNLSKSVAKYFYWQTFY
jgi:hypothetical protein